MYIQLLCLSRLLLPGIVSQSLTFMTLTFLRSAGQLLYRMFLRFSLPVLPHDR